MINAASGKSNTANLQGGQSVQAVDQSAGAAMLGGPGGSGGALSVTKDVKESSTEAKFGDVLKQIQAKYGGKEEKAREIKKQLGKDDFMRIMITQMRHQDPTSPFKPEQMAQEMAQFTSLEQLQNVNQNLLKMTQANQPVERLAMTNLIGKTVLVDRDRFPHAEGAKEAVSFALPKDAKNVTLTLIHESGETVLSKEIGPQKAGEVVFDWDGKKGNLLPAKPGNYMLKIEAKDESEKTIPTNGQAQARVVGLSFEGSEAVFLVGDPKNPSKVTMKNIVRIEDSPQGMGIPMQQSANPAAANQLGAAGANPGMQAPSSNPAKFVAFEKGVGSKPFDASSAPKEVQDALAKYAQEGAGGMGETARPAGAAASNAVVPPNPGLLNAKTEAKNSGQKGFPNGLHSD